MSLLSGLEKFGISLGEDLNILDEEPVKKATSTNDSVTAEVKIKAESDFLIDKKIRCPICDKDFPIKYVATTKLKRLEPDFDLRPNFEHVDTLKYDVISCPNCGYSALSSTFEKIDTARIKLVRNEFCNDYKPQRERLPEVYDYDYSCEKFKLALVCTIKKKGKLSEKAYVCLKLAWLRRAQLQQLMKEGCDDEEKLLAVKGELDGFYKQAYEGFLKALSTETPPYCGMSSEGVEFMLANMACHFKQYDVASKLVASLLTSPGTNKKIKDRCLDLKAEILESMKK